MASRVLDMSVDPRAVPVEFSLSIMAKAAPTCKQCAETDAGTRGFSDVYKIRSRPWRVMAVCPWNGPAVT